MHRINELASLIAIRNYIRMVAEMPGDRTRPFARKATQLDLQIFKMLEGCDFEKLNLFQVLDSNDPNLELIEEIRGLRADLAHLADKAFPPPPEEEAPVVSEAAVAETIPAPPEEAPQAPEAPPAPPTISLVVPADEASVAALIAPPEPVVEKQKKPTKQELDEMLEKKTMKFRERKPVILHPNDVAPVQAEPSQKRSGFRKLSKD